MSNDKLTKRVHGEIASLNVGELDVQELERRVELATLVAAACDQDCYSFTCTTNKPDP